VDSLAIPATTLDQLAAASKSVGYIHCGNVTGTGFLLTDNSFITSKHIHELIYKERKKTIFPQCCKTISVNFDYDSPQMEGFLQAEVDERRLPLTSQELDYVIYSLKDNPAPSKLKPLGPMVKSVKSSLPRSGSGILVGHPGNKNKVVENCRFIPDWRVTMEGRKSKALRYCEQHPAECFKENKAKLCIHNYKERNLEEGKDELAYDTTSFFEGSSGSPVFNSNGHIVAMHTRGCPYHHGGKKSCFMSFGTKFDAIYEDLIKQGRVEATSLFPTIKF
jgi:V8-like Glu-specific endopeptidase